MEAQDILSLVENIYHPVTDREARLIDERDLYNVRVQFGDPFMFLHVNVDFFRRTRDLEYIHFFYSLGEDRVEYISTLKEGFPDIRMLTEMNADRFFRNHDVVSIYRNHLLVASR